MSAGIGTAPEEPVNTTVLLPADGLKPDPVNVRVAPTAARVGDIDVTTSGASDDGGVNVIPGTTVPAATLAMIRRLRKKNSSIPYSGCVDET